MQDSETRLSDLRLDNNLKQKDVAKKLNVLRDTYSKWERGINDFSLEIANNLANLYDVSIDYLLGLSNCNSPVLKKEIDNKMLCERLLTLRKEHKLTQSKLSEAIGYHQCTYAHYEKGSRLPTINKLYLLAIYYNISIDYLLGRSDNKKINF